MAEQDQKYDATLRTMIAAAPRDWLALVGVAHPGKIRQVDTKLTFVREADRIFELGKPGAEWLLDLEVQTTYKPDLPDRMHVYSAILSQHRKQAVHSVVVLLRRKADGPAMTGRVRWAVPGRATYAEFVYDVIRLWRIPAQQLIEAGPGVAPLALLGDLGGPAETQLPALVQQLNRKWSRTLSEAQQQTLWIHTFLMVGLEYEEEFVNWLLEGVPGMRESSTFQAILREGRAEGRAEGRVEGLEEGLVKGRQEGADAMRHTLLRFGQRRLGEPSKRVQSAIRKIDDLDELQRLADRVLDVTSWAELLR